MAVDYYNPADKIVNTGDIVYASDLNRINSAVDAAFSLATADISALQGSTAVVEAKAWATAAPGTRPDILLDSYSAKAYAGETKGWAEGIGEITSASTGLPISGSVSAKTRAQQAASFATAAANDAALATTKAALAGDYANKAEDAQVESGTYSAYHWMKKSQAYNVDKAPINNPTFTGGVGIGGAVDPSALLGAYGTAPSSSNVSRIFNVNATIPSSSTAQGAGFFSYLNTATSSFTVNELTHFSAIQGSIGVGSSVNNQYGFLAHSSLIGATNNVGFLSLIPAGTGRWNFYAGGTASNYFAGSVSIGAWSLDNEKFAIRGTLPSASSMSFGSVVSASIPSTTTSLGVGMYVESSTVSSAFTLNHYQHFRASQSTIGASSSITNQSCFFASSNNTGAVNNYGFNSDIPAGTGRWNFYAGGTARNYFAGGVEVSSGTTSMTSGFIHIPAASGAPTGTPVNPTGNIPLYYDLAANRIYAYNGGWKYTNLI